MLVVGGGLEGEQARRIIPEEAGGGSPIISSTSALPSAPRLSVRPCVHMCVFSSCSALRVCCFDFYLQDQPSSTCKEKKSPRAQRHFGENPLVGVPQETAAVAGDSLNLDLDFVLLGFFL